LSIYQSRPHLILPSFPTRRSSDLTESHDKTAYPPCRDPSLANDRSAGGQEAHPEHSAGRFAAPAERSVPFALDLLGTERSAGAADRKSTRLNSSHVAISYAVFCLK